MGKVDCLVEVECTFVSKGEKWTEQEAEGIEASYPPNWEDYTEDCEDLIIGVPGDINDPIPIKNKSVPQFRITEDLVLFNFKIVSDGDGHFGSGVAFTRGDLGCDVFSGDLEEFAKKAREKRTSRAIETVRLLALYKYNSWQDYSGDWDTDWSLLGFVNLNDIDRLLSKEQVEVTLSIPPIEIQDTPSVNTFTVFCKNYSMADKENLHCQHNSSCVKCSKKEIDTELERAYFE